jgi:7,8-dihydroneopterin aldolase/epimerase/oxygenase
MSDRIQLSGLRVHGHHGVFDYEREHGQEFVVDVALEIDTRPAAASDELVDTVDYGALAHALANAIDTDPVNLLEVLAERLVQVCLGDERVEAATVTVHKPQAPIPLSFGDVSVTIRRERA